MATTFFASLGDDARSLGTTSAWGVTPSDYARLIRKYPAMLRDRILKTKTLQQMEQEAEHKGPLKRTLGPLGLICVGVGFMLGAGIFVTPGTIAVEYTGPAVCLAYAIAAVSAFLSCFCYCEFSVDMPLAGAAYTYIASTLGEFLAWVVTSNMLFEYILSAAAIVRGFASYFAVLIGKDSNYFLYTTEMMGKTYTMDWWGFGIVLALTALLAAGSKESSTFNTVVTITHVLVMVFIIVAGLTQADADNFTPFLPESKPQQWKELFNGASIAFFSYIGFDAVATAAEEVKDPAKMMPIGILGAMSVVTVIYVLMCVVLSLMVPTNMINPAATFAAAFDYVGMGWATHIVALGALLGILTATAMAIFAPARVLASATREGMLPPVLSWVGPRQTPWVATWVVGICSAMIALTTDFSTLSDMVSMGSLVVFWFVAVALLWRRMHLPGRTAPRRLVNQSLHMAALIGLSLGFTLVWTLPAFNTVDGVSGKWVDQQNWWLIGLGVPALLTPVSMFSFCKPAYVPSGYRVPLFPFVPCGSVFINTFLLGQLREVSFVRFGWWTLGVTVVYILYGVFASQVKDDKSSIEASIKADPSRSVTGPAEDPNTKLSGFKAVLEVGLPVSYSAQTGINSPAVVKAPSPTTVQGALSQAALHDAHGAGQV